MKRILFLIMLIIPSLITQAQKKWNMDNEKFFRFGFKGGLNVNKITGQSYKAGFNYNYQLGGFVQFNLGKIGIQPEINLVQTSSELSNDPTEIYDDLFRDGSQKSAKLDYLEVPVLVNLNLGMTRKFKLQFGPSYGGLLKQTVDSLKAGTGSIYKNGEWSGIAGFLWQFPLVHFGARYKLGFSNINAIDNRQTWKNQAIQIFLGVTF